jgi:hypothetical protein
MFFGERTGAWLFCGVRSGKALLGHDESHYQGARYPASRQHYRGVAASGVLA